jgi:predicted transcriptional regulator
MSTSKAEKAKIRLSLDVSPELNETLDELAQETGTTKSDILRKAIALMEVAVEAKQHQNRLGIFDQQQHLVREIVGI